MLQAENEKYEKSGIGIIIGRFQIPMLTEGHQQLIESVIERHDQCIILLGVAKSNFTKSNPLPYKAREKMITDIYPEVLCYPIEDNDSDEVWVRNVDMVIRNNTPSHRKDIVLYGSRDSFISCYAKYNGEYNFKILIPIVESAGTKVRNTIGVQLRSNSEFLSGIIYATHNMSSQPEIKILAVPFLKDGTICLKRSFPNAYYGFEPIYYNENTANVNYSLTNFDSELMFESLPLKNILKEKSPILVTQYTKSGSIGSIIILYAIDIEKVCEVTGKIRSYAKITELGVNQIDTLTHSLYHTYFNKGVNYT